MQPDSNKFLSDRFSVLPHELQTFIISEGLKRKTQLIAKKYRLNDIQETQLSNEITLVLMVLDSVDSLHLNIEETLGLKAEMAESLTLDVIDYIFKSVDQYLAHTQEELMHPSEMIDEKKQAYSSVISAPQELPAKPIFQEINSLPPSHVDEPITKEHILSQIENPPRTVIKKYVLTHEPITDPYHLIDDTVDQRPRLESHYND